MRKDLSEYTPAEIRQWQQSAYPSASGRTWRKRVRETTYHAVTKTLPVRCLPAVDGMVGLLAHTPSLSRLMPSLLGGGLIYLATPVMLALVSSTTGGVVPIETALIPLLAVARSCVGWLLVLQMGLACIGFVMEREWS
jgi:hypothetical protein